MIRVSDGFEKAIKSNNRNLYGYVDVKYQNKTYETTVVKVPQALEIFRSDGMIIADKKVMRKYATLENNYTLLDGSFTVWNENYRDFNGFVSDEIFENIDEPTIIISNSTNTPTKGITIYFKENLPFDFDVIFVDSDGNETIDNVHNNQSMIYQYVFPQEKTITRLSITINQVEFPKNRLRMSYIDFNLSDLFEGDELISFDVTEELDLLVESLPINNCEININNYPNEHGGNKFDPINPRGITGYLNDDVTIQPYVGVLTETNGVEYVPMGVFYLTDWSSNPNGNVTLNGKSVLNKIQEDLITSDGTFLRAIFDSERFCNFLNNTTNYNFDFIYYSSLWDHTQFMKNFKLIEYLKSAIIPMLYFDNFSDTYYEQFRKFYVNRYNTIKLNAINFNSVYNISRDLLTSDVEYTLKERVKKLNIKSNTIPQLSRPASASKESCIDITHTLVDSTEYLWLTSDKYMQAGSGELQYSVTSGQASATLIDSNTSSIYVEITGNVGSTIRIIYNDYVLNGSNIGTKTKSIINNSIQDGGSITVDLTTFIDDITAYTYPNSSRVPYKFEKIYFKLDKPYKVKAETLGDPSLEIGDTVSIQTRYQDVNDGYKNIIITKQKFTFDGGLKCSIEGVGD